MIQWQNEAEQLAHSDARAGAKAVGFLILVVVTVAAMAISGAMIARLLWWPTP